MKLISAIACLLGCSAFVSVAAPVPNFTGNPASNSLKTSVDAQFILAMQALNAPGLATVVVRDGSVRWLQTYGVLDRSQSETLASNKVGIDTPFRVASISKAVTATVAVRMAESPVGYLFSEYADAYLASNFPLVNPAFPSARVTLAQLLTHTSSILDNRAPYVAPPNISDTTLAGIGASAASNTLVYTDSRISDWIGVASTATTVGSGDIQYFVVSSPPSDGPLDIEQYLRRVLVPGAGDYPVPSFSPNRSYLAVQPGTAYLYSNVNSTLLGHVLERASLLKGVNKTFAQLADDFVFQPLGMTNASFALNSTSSAALAATAVPHDVTGPASDIIKRKAQVNLICSKVSGCNQPYSSAETTSTDYQPIAQYGVAERPAKGLRASIADLAKFVSMLASGGSAGGSQFLLTTTVAAMTTNQLAPGVHPDGTQTGLGLFRFAIDTTTAVTNDDVWGHEGGDGGVSSCFLFSKVTRYGVAIVANSPTQGNACIMAQDLYAQVCRSEGVCPPP